MDKRFIVILVIIVVAFGSFILFGKKSNTPGTNSTIGKVSNNVIGSAELPVEVVEYGDFQCPSCGQFFPIVTSIKKKYEGRVRFVFRNYPLDTIHPNARSAHRAAGAAGLQGKFFEMHDLLYTNQTSWSRSSNPKNYYDSYAKELGLDTTKFDTDFAAPAINDTINADVAEGQAKKVNGTPTFFINGKQIDNSQIASVELFSAKIDELLPAAAKTAPSAASSSETSTNTDVAPQN